jgi:hypothetical protein
LNPPNLRTFRQEPKFDEEVAALGITHKRLDAILASATYALAREPQRCEKIDGTSVSVYKTVVYPDAPSVRIFFTYTEDEVHLLHIEFCDDVTPWMKYEE